MLLIYCLKILLKKLKNEEELVELSNTDTLTGFKNRRAYNDMLDKYNGSNKDVSIIYFDIDGLKIMNDAFGHQEGDKLILIVANNISLNTKDKKASIYRLGGDEFIILLNDLSKQETLNLARKIQNELKKEVLNDLKVSVSFGISVKQENETIRESILRAETEMYDNKIIYNKRHPYKNIEAIMKVLSKKDPKLFTHVNNVEKYAELVGKKMNFNSYNLELLKSLARLHDIGKINLETRLLNNELTDENDLIMAKSHIDTGYRLLSRTPKYFDIAYDLLCQFENYDGTGYPNGIKGRNIPVKSRIIRVVNYYDHIVTYLQKSHKEAIKYLNEYSGKKFDPNIVDIFLKVIDE